jgi:hypothetical protein
LALKTGCDTYGSGPHRPAQEGSGAGMRPMALRGPWAMRIKKGLAATGMQRGSCVTEECARVIEASTRRAARQRYHGLQDVQAGSHRAGLQCSAHG